MSGWAPPAEFEGFRRLRPLAKGGMGEVWLFEEMDLSRSVAVKFIADPDADEQRRERFFTEARAIAQLANPNVVAVYRVGEVAGRPYLVTEFVPGETLASLERPVPRCPLLQVAVGLSSGLAAAHERGILHRDVKPSNAILIRKGDRIDVKLLDFGLAKFLEPAQGTLSADPPPDPLTSSGAVLGTLPYMAPECRLGEPATPRSDVFSLGAVLYELCTGAPPAAERTTRELLASDPALGRIIDRCIREAPAERFASAKELLAALKPLCPEMRAPPEGNPYRGLSAFDEEHRELFFGRDSEVEKVLERLRRERFILVAGDSGVGKSSLCRAGILPRVREGAIDPRGRASVLRIVPGRRPVRALAEALAPLRDGQPEALAHWLRNEPAALPRTLPAIRGISVILLFVDQLEEVVTIADRDEAAAFMTALAALAASEAPARILAAVRGDFFTRIAEQPGLGESAPAALFLLRPMAPERLRQTVVEPAQKAGIAFESAEMIDSLVDDAARAGGGLPLLQFTMAELWDGRDVEARRIPATALTRIGGVAAALARHADDVISHLLPDQRAASRRVLLRLITAQGTRARASAQELTGDQAEARAALEALVQGRLVVAHEAEGGATEYAVAHEALLTDWGTLREWIEADGDRRQIRARIAAAAAEWERLGRNNDTLWDRGHLAEASRVDPAELNPAQRAFLDASSRRVTRSKRLRILLLAAGPVIATTVIAGVRWRTQAEIDAQATARAARGLDRLSEARQIDVRATRSREEALRAFSASKTSEDWQRAETAWSAVIEQRSSADAAYESAEVAFESALAIHPYHASTRARMADALFLRASLARRFGERRSFSRLAQRLGNLQGEGRSRSGFSTPARLAIDVKPHGSAVSLVSFESSGGRMRRLEARALGASPLTLPELTPGSHLLIFRDGAAREFTLPLLADGGEDLSVAFSLPPQVPAGYVFVPPGRFLAGFGDDDAIRRTVGAPPAHQVVTGAYFIARQEVTFEQYVSFLESLDERERMVRRPFHKADHGTLELRRARAGWELILQPTVHVFRALWGEPIRYPKRSSHAVHDWRRFPVAAISLRDAHAYVNWLSRNGLPGAHVCNDHEWERAARGADGREFTTGDKLVVSEVNIDVTYGRDPWSYGPDEVGAHPESDSVFGVQDMVGNAMEMVVSVGGFGPGSIRGGSWYYDEWSARLPARFPLEETTRSATVGFRVCAPAAID